jgi:hypothetical protein
MQTRLKLPDLSQKPNSSPPNIPPRRRIPMMEETKTRVRINSCMQQSRDCVLASPFHALENSLEECQDIGLLIEKLRGLKSKWVKTLGDMRKSMPPIFLQ